MQRKLGFTLVEVIVVAAILLTLVGLLWPAFSAAWAAATGKPEEVKPSGPPRSFRLYTAQHDGHWWVMSPDHFEHHPDCPCPAQNAEKENR